MNKLRTLVAIFTISISISACNSPFLISMFSNQNVYKTKDTLNLKVVFDIESSTPFKDEKNTFKVMPQSAPSEFLRYSVVKDGEKPFIYILPLTKFKKNSNDNTIIIEWADTSNYQPNNFYYQFTEKKSEISPARHYLSTEHITGIPLTIPIKYRFNAPDNKTPFSLNASISYAFGYKIRVNNNPYKDNFIRLLPLVAGFSTDTYLARDSIKVAGYKGETSVALNLAVGATYEVGDRFNVGLFLGKDRMFANQKDWIYQNRTWLGFGLGYKFAATKEEKE